MARQSPCASYPILTFPEVRTSSSTSLAAAERGSVGGGEAACAVVPAAIGSAVFEATGVRFALGAAYSGQSQCRAESRVTSCGCARSTALRMPSLLRKVPPPGRPTDFPGVPDMPGIFDVRAGAILSPPAAPTCISTGSN
jgi:hypothetical protein